ncbi:hypothetical protein ABIC45_003366 [Mucilaginibacter rubeus]|uniref:type II toxin-antitoxin system toxin DNA ADP-ribosyl transferase DarT n=1 Tax=Mucilaginibacter rubeus TaxID=2027860 RepID=UPI003395DE58
MINKNRTFCYRITHRDNLSHILQYGLLNKNHVNADPGFVAIGNPEIIDVRSTTPVYLKGYGLVGEYVPFYFTPRSIMLYNIVTGYYAPKVPKREKEEIIVIRCMIKRLIMQDRWFFTNGQANDEETTHFANINFLDRIDWSCIQQSNFSKSDGDYDRQRRYQAEFLVYESVPVACIESICVYNEKVQAWAQKMINDSGKQIPLHIHKPYFFD